MLGLCNNLNSLYFFFILSLKFSSFAVVDSGQLVNIPRVRNHDGITYFDSESEV